MLGWATAAVGLLLLLRDVTRIGQASAISTVFEIAFDLFLVSHGTDRPASWRRRPCRLLATRRIHGGCGNGLGRNAGWGVIR